MRAPPARAGRGVMAAALAAAEAWLLEPADPVEVAQPAPPPLIPAPPGPCPVVVVAGLAHRCGASTVARALGAELAARHPSRTCVVAATGAVSGGPRLGAPAALRLARTLDPLAPGHVRATGRLCMVAECDPVELADAARALAPVVLELGCDAPERAASIADHVFLVAAPRVEPALAAVVAESLARVGPPPVVVLNRSEGGGSWEGRAGHVLPEARMGAQLALSGREPRGALGRALAELAERCSVGGP